MTLTVSADDLYTDENRHLRWELLRYIDGFFDREKEWYSEEDLTETQLDQIFDALQMDTKLAETKKAISDAYREFFTMCSPDDSSDELYRLAKATHAASKAHRDRADEIIRGVIDGDSK